MIGFVALSSSEAVQRLVRSLKLSVGSKPRPSALEEDLAAQGIKVYSLERVRAYQKSFLRHARRMGQAGKRARWEEYSFVEYRKWSEDYPGQYPPMPGEIQQTARKALTIPETGVLVEWFYADPFIFITRRRHRATEKCCIGYWNAPDFQP